MDNASFKKKLSQQHMLLGAFVKTPHPIIIEIMGSTEFDFLVLDAEHAPFDKGTIDSCIIAGRAVGCPLLVRIPHADTSWILSVLDMGAAGLMVPHVKNAAIAADIVQMATYGANGRGFAGTTRAAKYAARTMREHLAGTAEEISIVCQIEEPEGVQNARQIANVVGVDALFVGRADLAVANGSNDFQSPQTTTETNNVLNIENVSTGLFCAPDEAFNEFKKQGASMFVVGSDHSLMANGTRAIRQRFETGTE